MLRVPSDSQNSRDTSQKHMRVRSSPDILRMRHPNPGSRKDQGGDSPKDVCPAKMIDQPCVKEHAGEGLCSGCDQAEIGCAGCMQADHQGTGIALPAALQKQKDTSRGKDDIMILIRACREAS